MLKWLDIRAGGGKGGGNGIASRVTDDPLATISQHPGRGATQPSVYAVSRSVLLPRVALKNQGINPIFVDDNVADLNCAMCVPKPDPLKQSTPRRHHRQGSSSPPSAGKSSGYGSRLQSHSGSSQSDPIYSQPVENGHNVLPTKINSKTPHSRTSPKHKFRKDAIKIIEQNTAYVKSIMVTDTNISKNKKQMESLGSSSAGTLSTIPEGKVDVSIPRPIWPKYETSQSMQHNTVFRRLNFDQNDHPDNNLYDSIVDDTLLYYTTLNKSEINNVKDAIYNVEPACATHILRDLSKTINEIIDGKVDQKPEEILRGLNEKITMSLEALQLKSNTTEDDVKNLCHQLSSDGKLKTVARALCNSSSSSGNSSQQSVFGDWDQTRLHRLRTISSGTEDLYHEQSASSSSGFSDLSPNKQLIGSRTDNGAPVFVHKDLSSVPNGVRNAMIYGTLCRSSGSASVKNVTKLISGEHKTEECADRKLLTHAYDERPSTWQIYYGAGVTVGDVRLKAKPTDTPNFPAGGRPEADFTLDVPRAELLMRRMKADKRWRCRCRIFTSFLGLAFFLLSVMAVSLMLTRGKRMFGSIGAAGF